MTQQSLLSRIDKDFSWLTNVEKNRLISLVNEVWNEAIDSSATRAMRKNTELGIVSNHPNGTLMVIDSKLRSEIRQSIIELKMK